MTIPGGPRFLAIYSGVLTAGVCGYGAVWIRNRAKSQFWDYHGAPVQQDGKPELQFLDENGNVVSE